MDSTKSGCVIVGRSASDKPRDAKIERMIRVTSERARRRAASIGSPSARRNSLAVSEERNLAAFEDSRSARNPRQTAAFTEDAEQYRLGCVFVPRSVVTVDRNQSELMEASGQSVSKTPRERDWQ